jgi:hypothetical protein
VVPETCTSPFSTTARLYPAKASKVEPEEIRRLVISGRLFHSILLNQATPNSFAANHKPTLQL